MNPEPETSPQLSTTPNFTSGLPHIGAMIKATLKALGHNGAWLATQLGCDRTYIYKVFAKDTIDTALLLKISLLLNHNFFDLFTEEWAHKIAEAPQAQPASNIKLP